ncbi:MAG TPA: hypothetical protein VHM30_11535 [Gemmatimonadaceae bacterium]|nr:hypothetical protein [Gemmatimonadaceae bacterium]
MTTMNAEQADRERRLRPRFRALIDEMMEQIRRVAKEADWDGESRARAEADLERIMSQVRRAAMQRDDH